MDMLDELRAEVTSILNQEGVMSDADIRRLGYLEARINSFLARYDY